MNCKDTKTSDSSTPKKQDETHRLTAENHAESRNRISQFQITSKETWSIPARIEHDRKVAVLDLLEDNFMILSQGAGPYRVVAVFKPYTLMVFHVSDLQGCMLTKIELRLGPIRQHIQTYQDICTTYFDAIRTRTASQIETIDMARRGLHDEGAQLIYDKFKPYAQINIITARRLFTLINSMMLRKA